MAKKFIFLIIIVSIGFYYYMQHGMPVKQEFVMRVGVEGNYIPYSWISDKKNDFNFPIANIPESYIDGYDVQIAKTVADYMKVKIEFRKIEWEKLFDALNNNEINVVFSGMLDTDERKKIVDFSDTYEHSKAEYAVLVHNKSGFQNASSLKDLSGAKILGQKETYFDTVIDQIPGVVHVPPVHNVTSLLESVVEFKVDGIVIDTDTGKTYERTYKNLTLLKFSEGEGFKLDFTGSCAAVRKGDETLMKSINKAIASITMKERKRIMDRVISRVWENM